MPNKPYDQLEAGRDDEAAAEITRLRAEREWRDIASADRTVGEFVNLWAVSRLLVDDKPAIPDKGQRHVLARWVDWVTGVGHWIDMGGNPIEFRGSETSDGSTIVSESVVTHWMPLPSPPPTQDDKP